MSRTTDIAIHVCNAAIDSSPEGGAEVFHPSENTFLIGTIKYKCTTLGLINAILDQLKAERIAIEFDEEGKPSDAKRWRPEGPVNGSRHNLRVPSQ